MNARCVSFATSPAVVRGVIAAAAVVCSVAVARAQDAPPPTSSIEIGLGGVSDASYKAGEYTGLHEAGAYGIANVDLRDRAPRDGASALRWRVQTWDLGLATRSGVAELGVQGKYRLLFGFDQLRRNRSDSYQSPFDATGTNALTLPGAWVLPTIASPAGNTVSARGLFRPVAVAPYLSTAANNFGAILTPTATQIAGVDAGIAADLPAFRNVNLFTTRTRYDVGFAYNVNQWGLKAEVRPEHKDGLKPMGTVSRNSGGDISTIVPDVIDNNHNQVDSSLSYSGKRSAVQVAYYGSFFKNNVSSMSWQNWATAAHTVNTMSSAPSNDFNQINATALFKVGATTKIAANGAYGRASQNDVFLTDAFTRAVPVPSLNGRVVTTQAGVRLTSRPAPKLNVTAAYKYDDRDNQTPVNIYQYADAGETVTINTGFPASPTNPLGAMVANNANANRAYARTLNQASFDAEYAVASRQWIKAGYVFERITRGCNGSWISCADADTTNENALRLDWRASVGTSLTARVGYAHARRRTPGYNENAFLALVPYANVSPTAATGGATALSFMTSNGWNGWGPALGYAATTGNMNVFFPSNNALANAQYGNANRISELQGLRRYWVADRDRDQLRSSLLWQANETFGFQGGVNINRDDYADATYGLQGLKGWAADADMTYSPSDTLSADVFYTYEHQRSVTGGNTYTANSNAATVANSQPGVVGLSGNSCDTYTTLLQRNNNNKLDPCLNWSSANSDEVNTIGLTVQKKTVKVNLTGDMTFSRARSDNAMTGGSWANNPRNGPGGPPTTIAAYYIPATSFPTVSTDTTEVRMAGAIPVVRNQSLRVAYAYLRMRSSDWVYQGMQVGEGTLSGVLPTNEQPFSYNVSVVTATYILRF